MARKGSSVRIQELVLDRPPGLTLHRSVHRTILHLILSGVLPPGSRLPSTRSLSLQLGISRNSVMHAYEQLSAEGYLEPKVGSGTVVCHQIPDSAFHKRQEFRRQTSVMKLTRLIAQSGYPLERVGFEDWDGNSIYCYSDSSNSKPN